MISGWCPDQSAAQNVGCPPQLLAAARESHAGPSGVHGHRVGSPPPGHTRVCHEPDRTCVGCGSPLCRLVESGSPVRDNERRSRGEWHGRARGTPPPPSSGTESIAKPTSDHRKAASGVLRLTAFLFC